jgi:hypothetical protein
MRISRIGTLKIPSVSKRGKMSDKTLDQKIEEQRERLAKKKDAEETQKTADAEKLRQQYLHRTGRKNMRS